MDINITGLVLTIAPALVFIAKLYFNEFITNLVKSLFNSKSNKQADKIFNIIMLTLILVGGSTFISYSDTEQENTLSSEYNIDVINEGNQVQKTDAEVYFEAGEKTIELTADLIEQHKAKSEQIKNSKGKYYVYQIGNITKNQESIFELYYKLVFRLSFEPKQLAVLEVSRNEYLLYYETMEKDSSFIFTNFLSFKSKLTTTSATKIIDLYTHCGAREVVKEQKKQLKRRKYDFAITQCECAK